MVRSAHPQTWPGCSPLQAVFRRHDAPQLCDPHKSGPRVQPPNLRCRGSWQHAFLLLAYGFLSNYLVL